MLGIGRLAGGQENYYLAQVGGAEEYYTGTGEAPGAWLGAGAEALGLRGQVDPSALRLVLAGRDPNTGGTLADGRRGTRGRAGFDLTFSAPKGVSLLALVGPPEVRAAATAAHRAAVADTLAHVERAAVWVRRGQGGAERMSADGLIAAAFPHRSSRSGDPQLHTHVLVANIAQGADGRWSAPDGRALFAHAKTAGYLYQAALRAELTRRLGIRWGPVRAGMAEPALFTPAQLRAFSTRRSQVELELEARGAQSARAAEKAVLATRPAKDRSVSVETMTEAWKVRAEMAGIELDHLARTLVTAGQPQLAPESLMLDLLGPIGLTRHASTFDNRALLRAVAERAAAGATVGTIEARAAEVLSHPDVVALGPDRTGEARWTTREMLAIESRILKAARRGRERVALVPAPIVARVLAERSELSDEQRNMVVRLVGAGTPVEVVVGPAGSGKTFALAAANAAWRASGIEVMGAALAARAAAELQAGTGIPSGTVARLLADLDRSGPGDGLPPGSVLVIDEAGMVGTRTLARLVDATERSRAKLVLCGDPRQLPEIEAGGVLGGLVRRHGAIELVENRRQHLAWERAALAELRAGDPAAALAAYQAAGRVVTAESAADVRDAMVGDWWLTHQEGADAVMYALRRTDVDALNTMARHRLRAAGELGPFELEAAGRAFATGDEVLALRNDRRLGVVNGSRGIVTSVDLEAVQVTVALAGGGTVTLTADYLDAGRLGHGYAMTVHKGQGATVDRAFLLGSELLYREAGYVGMSRARQGSHLYMVAAELSDREHSHGRGPDDEYDPMAELLRGLRTSRAQDLAIDVVSRAVPFAGAPNAAGPGDNPGDAVDERWRLSVGAEPDPHLRAALGPLPDDARREAWVRAALLIDAYRERWAVTDPERALGPRPRGLPQLAEWAQTSMAVERAREHLGWDRSRGRGREEDW